MPDRGISVREVAKLTFRREDKAVRGPLTWIVVLVSALALALVSVVLVRHDKTTLGPTWLTDDKCREQASSALPPPNVKPNLGPPGCAAITFPVDTSP